MAAGPAGAPPPPPPRSVFQAAGKAFTWGDTSQSARGPGPGKVTSTRSHANAKGGGWECYAIQARKSQNQTPNWLLNVLTLNLTLNVYDQVDLEMDLEAHDRVEVEDARLEELVHERACSGPGI